MRLTESQLRSKIKKIISETLLLEHEMSLVLNDDGIYLVDDEGNEEYFADSDEADSYGLYRVGDAVPYERRSGGYGRSSGGYGRSSGRGYSSYRRRY